MSDRVSDRVRAEWRNRIEAEYRSAAASAEMSLWLMRIAASPDLIRSALRIADDEIEHARMSSEVYAEAGGEEPPDIQPGELGLLRRHPVPLDQDVVRNALAVFCLGETVAVPLFAHLRSGCVEPVARAALDRILLDEVRHRDFGWDLLGWMVERDPEHRRLIETHLPAGFAELEVAYGGTRAARLADAGAEAIDDADRRWGLAPAAEYAEILERSIDRDFTPRFAELGIDAAAAWSGRHQVDSTIIPP